MIFFLIKTKDKGTVSLPADPAVFETAYYLQSNIQYREDKAFQETFINNLQYLEEVPDPSLSTGFYIRFKYGRSTTFAALQAETVIHPSGFHMVEDTGENDAFRDPPFYMPVYQHDPLAVSGDYPSAAGGFWIFAFNIQQVVFPSGNITPYVPMYNEYNWPKPYIFDAVYTMGVDNRAGVGVDPIDFKIQGVAEGGDPENFQDLLTINFTNQTSEIFVTATDWKDISGTPLNNPERLTPNFEAISHRATSLGTTNFQSIVWAPTFLAFVVRPADGVLQTLDEIIESYLGNPPANIDTHPVQRPTWSDFKGACNVRHDGGSQQLWFDTLEPYKRSRYFSIDLYHVSSEQCVRGYASSLSVRVDPQAAAAIRARGSKFYLNPLNNKFDIIGEFQNQVDRGNKIYPCIAQTNFINNVPVTATSQYAFVPADYNGTTRYFAGQTVKVGSPGSYVHWLCIDDYPTGYDGSNPIDTTNANYWELSDYPVTNQTTGEVDATYPVVKVQRLPTNDGTDGTQASHWSYVGEMINQIGAAFGSNESAVVDRTVDPIGPAEGFSVNGVPMIDGIGFQNEIQGPWKDLDEGFATSLKVAYYTSALIDGHCGTLGPGVGLWRTNSDPNMDFVWDSDVKPNRATLVLAWKIMKYLRLQTGAVDNVNYYADPIKDGTPLGTGKVILAFNVYSNISGDQVIDAGGADDPWQTAMGEYQVREYMQQAIAQFPNNLKTCTEWGIDEMHGFTWNGSAWVAAGGVTSFVAPPLIEEHLFIGPYNASGVDRYGAPWTKAVIQLRGDLLLWYNRLDRAYMFQYKSNTARGGVGFVGTFATCGLYDRDGDPWFGVFIGYAFEKFSGSHWLVSLTDRGAYYEMQTQNQAGDKGWILFKKTLGGSPVSATITGATNGFAYEIIPYGMTATGWDASKLTAAPGAGNIIGPSEGMVAPVTAQDREGSLSSVPIVSNELQNVQVMDMPMWFLNTVSDQTPPPGVGDELLVITDDTSLATYTHEVSFMDFNAGANTRINMLHLHGNNEVSLAAAKTKGWCEGSGEGVIGNLTGNRALTLQYCIDNDIHLHLVVPYEPNMANVGNGVFFQYGTYINNQPHTYRAAWGLSGGGIVVSKILAFDPELYDKHFVVCGSLYPWINQDHLNSELGWWHGDADGTVSIIINQTNEPAYRSDPTMEGVFSVIYEGADHFIWNQAARSARAYQFLTSPASTITDYSGATIPDV